MLHDWCFMSFNGIIRLYFDNTVKHFTETYAVPWLAKFVIFAMVSGKAHRWIQSVFYEPNAESGCCRFTHAVLPQLAWKGLISLSELLRFPASCLSPQLFVSCPWPSPRSASVATKFCLLWPRCDDPVPVPFFSYLDSLHRLPVNINVTHVASFEYREVSWENEEVGTAVTGVVRSVVSDGPEHIVLMGVYSASPSWLKGQNNCDSCVWPSLFDFPAGV